MGWTGYPYDRRKPVDIIREELVGYGTRYKVVAHSGHKYWVLEDTDDGSRYAIVVVTERQRGDLYTKVMDEGMGPYDHKFPLRFLDLLTEPRNEYATEWRQQVRDYHARKKAQPKLELGVTVVFSKPIEFSNGASYDRLTYLGKYRFRANDGTRVSLSKNWRDTYDWTILTPVGV